MLLVRKALLKNKRNCCLPPSLQEESPLGLQLLAQMVTEAHPSYMASLMLAWLNFHCFLYSCCFLKLLLKGRANWKKLMYSK